MTVLPKVITSPLCRSACPSLPTRRLFTSHVPWVESRSCRMTLISLYTLAGLEGGTLGWLHTVPSMVVDSLACSRDMIGLSNHAFSLAGKRPLLIVFEARPTMTELLTGLRVMALEKCSSPPSDRSWTGVKYTMTAIM